MLYHLYQWLSGFTDIPGMGLFRYLSFRATIAFVLAMLLAIPFGKRFINRMQRLQIGEDIRDLGLQGQLQKRGTPTMGGILIIVSTILPVFLLADLTNVYIIIMIITTLWLAMLGWLDDYIKVFKRRKGGLNGWLKILGQVLLGLFVGAMMWLSPEIGVAPARVASPDSPPKVEIESRLEKSCETTVPFFKNSRFGYREIIPFDGALGDALSWLLFVGVVVVLIVLLSNGANFTDGLDGLATGVSVPMAAAMGLFAYVSGNIIYSSYLNIVYIPQSGELVVFSSAFMGALIGFLWNNCFPAKIFMGDTGSLSIGGIIGIFFILVRKELILPIVAGVFLWEIFSVVIQSGWFKYTRLRTGTGRRVFLMAPIHHHYQKKGIPEPRIVTRMWIISLLCSVLAVLTLKLR